MAAGPLRVDWTFRDLDWKDNVDATLFTASRTRSTKHLSKTFDAMKGAHNGKDAHNCQDAQGGLRGAGYYKAPFGLRTNSLMPWRLLDDSGASVVCTVAHEDLGQEEARVYTTHLGKAGVYLNLSERLLRGVAGAGVRRAPRASAVSGRPPKNQCAAY